MCITSILECVRMNCLLFLFGGLTNGSGRAMWPEIRDLRTSLDPTELLAEIVVRVVLLLTTWVMQLCVKPNSYNISESALLKKYKYPRRDSYVPPWATVVIVLFVPLMAITVSLHLTGDYVEATQSFLAWTLALSINALVTEIVKTITGRPRPDYFYRCFPDGKMTKRLICTGDSKDVFEGRKSFPSGHSSFAFCSMGFLSFWLYGRLAGLSRSGGVVASLGCGAPIAVAAAVAVSRCCDNHHHWQDVVVGSMLGLVSSYVCYIRYYNLLNSEMSGHPYVKITKNYSSHNMSQTNCCTTNTV